MRLLCLVHVHYGAESCRRETLSESAAPRRFLTPFLKTIFENHGVFYGFVLPCRVSPTLSITPTL